MSNLLLENFPVVIQLPVQWGDMDAYGHVNNTVYFKFFESARIAYLDRCGFLASFTQNRIGPILHSTDCRFRRALTYPDTVLVGARAIDVREDRMTMGYRIISRSAEDIVAEGTGVVVSFDYDAGDKTPLPDSVRTGIQTLEAQRSPRQSD